MVDPQEVRQLVDQLGEEEFPMEAGELAEEMEEAGAPDDVVNFYEDLDEVRIGSKDEAVSLAEQGSDPNLTVSDSVTAYDEEADENLAA